MNNAYGRHETSHYKNCTGNSGPGRVRCLSNALLFPATGIDNNNVL